MQAVIVPLLDFGKREKDQQTGEVIVVFIVDFVFKDAPLEDRAATMQDKVIVAVYIALTILVFLDIGYKDLTLDVFREHKILRVQRVVFPNV